MKKTSTIATVGTITCPHCHQVIPLTEALTTQLRENINRELTHDFEQREKELHKQLATEANARAEASVAIRLKDLESQVVEQNRKLVEAQTQELDLRKQRRKLEAEKAALELSVDRRLDEERPKIQQAAQEKFAEQHRLKEAEKDRSISELKQKIDELQRRANQGSQQAQGEVLEEDLEQELRLTFPHDEIVAVAKGQNGADVQQVVRDRGGRECGIILWETKNAKSWGKPWVAKIKDDALNGKAHLAVILSTVLPKEIKGFGQIDGVWVTNHSCCLGLTVALREQLISSAVLYAATVGKNQKMELLFNYLRGPEFTRRVESIVSTVCRMKDQVERERKALTRIWAEREKQIATVTGNLAGMYGDLQGLTDAALPPVPTLELPLGIEPPFADGASPDLAA
jgi:hypothetical protein